MSILPGELWLLYAGGGHLGVGLLQCGCNVLLGNEMQLPRNKFLPTEKKYCIGQECLEGHRRRIHRT